MVKKKQKKKKQEFSGRTKKTLKAGQGPCGQWHIKVFDILFHVILC